VVQSGLEQIQFAGQRAAALTRQLLAFSRKEIARAEAIDLDRVLTHSEKMLRRLLREDIKFAVDIAPGPHRICADEGQIAQVIMNLVLNARDAMPDGGTLTVTCTNVELDNAHTFAHLGAKPGPHVMLTVSDTGVGMSTDTMDHMFEPFFTTKPVGKGTGLGLPTIYGIMKQAGAHITVDSEPGKGSIFRLYFPQAKAAEPESVAKLSHTDLGGDEQILVCEDEPLVRRVTCQILRSAGYSVLEAENGRHALEVAAQHDGEINLLMSDVIMPEMNGRELAEAMVQRRPGIRVIFVSGYTDEVLDGRISQQAGTDFLQKPFSPTVLLQRVRELLNR
jgi:CheY-like chemotaxis protein